MIVAKTSARALSFSSLPPVSCSLFRRFFAKNPGVPHPPYPFFASSYFCNQHDLNRLRPKTSYQSVTFDCLFWPLLAKYDPLFAKNAPFFVDFRHCIPPVFLKLSFHSRTSKTTVFHLSPKLQTPLPGVNHKRPLPAASLRCNIELAYQAADASHPNGEEQARRRARKLRQGIHSIAGCRQRSLS